MSNRDQILVETEWQFSTTSLDAVEEWFARISDPEIVTDGKMTAIRIHDTYFDTADWKVFRAGYSLRIRRSGGSWEATLKSLDGKAGARVERREISQRISSNTLEALFEAPGAVSERMLRVCQRQDLRPLVDIRTVRRETQVQLKHGSGLLCLDRSTCPSGRGRAHLERIELEVVEGAPEGLVSFVERLQRECSLTPSTGSKFSWGLSVSGEFPPVKPKSRPTFHEASTISSLGLATFQAQVSLLNWNEPGTRFGDDPKYIHDMRVAARRLRAALRLLREADLPRDKIDALNDKVRTLGSALGSVRDLDVRMQQLEALRPSLVAASPDSLDPYLAVLEQERERAREAMVQYLDSAPNKRLFSSLQQKLVRKPALTEESSLAYKAAPRLIRRARRKAVRLGDDLSATSLASDFHRLRILCKRYRYTLEFMEPAYGETCRSMIEEVTRIQDLLGTLQDAQVAIDSLRASSPNLSTSLPAPTLLALGEIAQLHRHRRDAILAEFPSVFKKLHGKKWKALKREMNERARDLPDRMPPRFEAPEGFESTVGANDSPVLPVVGPSPAPARKRPKSGKG